MIPRSGLEIVGSEIDVYWMPMCWRRIGLLKDIIKLGEKRTCEIWMFRYCLLSESPTVEMNLFLWLYTHYLLKDLECVTSLRCPAILILMANRVQTACGSTLNLWNTKSPLLSRCLSSVIWRMWFLFLGQVQMRSGHRFVMHWQRYLTLPYFLFAWTFRFF